MKKKKIGDKQMRDIAERWLEVTEAAMKASDNSLQAAFIGSYIFAQGRPVTLSEIARTPWAGNRTQARRMVERLMWFGVAERTDEGIVATELGKQTASYYFAKLHSLLES